MSQTPDKPAPVIEILHLDEMGYGPNGSMTRRAWREACLTNLLAGKEQFEVWQNKVKTEDKEATKVSFGFSVDRKKIFNANYENLNSCALDFAGHTFEDGVYANEFSFFLPCLFNSTTFNAVAGFRSAIFYGNALFGSAIFSGNALFESVCFNDEAIFSYAAFSGMAAFDSADFKSNSNFGRASFNGVASFGRASFRQKAKFIFATFSRNARFEGSIFEQIAWFDNAIFNAEVRFKSTTFINDAVFESAVFNEIAVFEKTLFNEYAVFERVVFARDAVFERAVFSQEAVFEKVVFGGDAVFDGTIFSNRARFESALFRGDARYHVATFSTHAFFNKIVFEGKVNFDKAHFDGTANFQQTIFEDQAIFESAVFDEGSNFERTVFVGGTIFNNAKFIGFSNIVSKENITIQYLDSIGYGPKGQMTRKEWRSECFKNFSKSKNEFSIWQESVIRDYDGKEIAFSLRLNGYDKHIFEITCALDFVGFPFNEQITAKEYKFLLPCLFDYSNFSDNAFFQHSIFLNSVSYRNVTFEKLCYFENSIFKKIGHFENSIFKNITPNFRGVEIATTRLEFADAKFPKNIGTQEAVDDFSFLKRLSDEHGQADQVLNFNAMELRTKRLLPDADWGFKTVTWLYQVLSDFGRSITKPVFSYLALICFGAFLAMSYSTYIANPTKEEQKLCLPIEGQPPPLKLSYERAVFEYAMFRAGGVMDFTDTGKQNNAVNCRLFGEPIEPPVMRAWGVFKGIASIALLFLAALGLRNKYRIK